METVTEFIFGGSKITADGDCSHEIKRCLLLGRKVMTNLDSILKSRDITLSTKVRLVKPMVFPVVMFIYLFIFISWRLITLQYCSGFCHTLTWISHEFTGVPHPEPPSRLLPHPIPLGLPQYTSPEHLSHASNLDWRSVSPLIIYLFQCYSLRTSHPRLLPQSPKVCSDETGAHYTEWSKPESSHV